MLDGPRRFVSIRLHCLTRSNGWKKTRTVSAHCRETARYKCSLSISYLLTLEKNQQESNLSSAGAKQNALNRTNTLKPLLNTTLVLHMLTEATSLAALLSY